MFLKSIACLANNGDYIRFFSDIKKLTLKAFFKLDSIPFKWFTSNQLYNFDG